MNARTPTQAVAAIVATAMVLALAGGQTAWAGTPAQSEPAAASASAGAATAPVPAATPAAQAGEPVLSNERTITTWVHPVEEAAIRARPETGARTIRRTHLVTEDGYPEVYLVLATALDARGREWVRVRIPGRPNGLTGWVPAIDLSPFHITRWHIVIDLGRRSLKAYRNGHLRFAAPVGVGKPSTPTPTGNFWVREIFRVSSRGNPYWPWAIGTSAYSRLTDWPGGGVVGLHGDFGEPQAIPGDPSHGCVRMRDGDLERLAPLIQLGTPITIVR